MGIGRGSILNCARIPTSGKGITTPEGGSRYWTQRTPSNLLLSQVNESTLKVSFTKNGIGYDGFKVEMSSDGGINYAVVATLGINTNYYHKNTLTLFASYKFRVRAYKGSSYSEYTDVITAYPVKVIKFGYLYNWYACNNAKKLSSSDTWRIPTSVEMAAIGTTLGGAAGAGAKLRDKGTTFGGLGTDNVNVSIRPAGYRTASIFGELAGNGYLWTIPEIAATTAETWFIGQAFIQNYTVAKVNGGQVRFIRDSVIGDPVNNGDFCSDYIGNDLQVYKTIRCGNYVITQEELVETKYRDGSSIPVITVQGTWAADTTGAMCAYNNTASNVNYTNVINRIGVIGDSTIAVYGAFNSVFYYLSNLYYNTSSFTSIGDIATAGETIANQNTRWTDLSGSIKRNFDYVFVQVGLNDTDPAESAATAIGRLQDLIDNINTDCPNSVIIIGTMTPCKARLITVYGAVNGLVAYQKWLDMNEAIRGNGVNPITGVDDYVDNHTTLLNDGSGNLAATYNSGDDIHENNDGREVIANSWFAKINS